MKESRYISFLRCGGNKLLAIGPALSRVNNKRSYLVILLELPHRTNASGRSGPLATTFSSAYIWPIAVVRDFPRPDTRTAGFGRKKQSLKLSAKNGSELASHQIRNGHRLGTAAIR